MNTPHAHDQEIQESECLRPVIDSPTLVLEKRMEAAGQRIAAYLRHFPMMERSRHALALKTLEILALDPGTNPTEAQARGMRILRELLRDEHVTLPVLPGPTLSRSHMKPEEMDRRPWVGIFLRVWRPTWLMSAAFTNMSYLDLLRYAVLLAGLYAM